MVMYWVALLAISILIYLLLDGFDLGVGMLFGMTSGEAFFVKCDAELNPPEVRDAGQLVIDVGLAPVKPAEFVIFRLSQIAGGGA